MAFGRQQSDPGSLVFEKRIRRYGRTVDDPLGLRQQRCEFDAERICQQLQPIEDADRGVFGGRRNFGERRPTKIVDRDEIGKRPADVDANTVHQPPLNFPPPQAGEGRGWGL